MKSQDDRATRLQHLVRRNAGKRELDAYAREYSIVLDRSDWSSALLSLEDTDQLFSRWQHLLDDPGSMEEQKSFRRSFPLEQVANLERFLTCFAQRTESDNVALFSPYSENCGGLQTGIRAILAHALDLLRVGRDALSFVSVEDHEAFSLDRYLDQPDGQFYEVIVAGETWSFAARSCTVSGKNQ